MEPDEVRRPRYWVTYQIYRSMGVWQASKPMGVTETLDSAKIVAANHADDYWHCRNLQWISGGGAKGIESYQATLPHGRLSRSKPWHGGFPDAIESEIAYVVEGF